MSSFACQRNRDICKHNLEQPDDYSCRWRHHTWINVGRQADFALLIAHDSSRGLCTEKA